MSYHKLIIIGMQFLTQCKTLCHNVKQICHNVNKKVGQNMKTQSEVTMGVRLPKILHDRLEEFAQSNERPKSFYIRKALEKFLKEAKAAEEAEDARDAKAAHEAYEEWQREGGKTISFEQLLKDVGLD